MGELSLEVTDDGQGFADQDKENPRGSGLHGMSERLSAIGGRLSLAPAEPGHKDHNDHNARGFRLVATVPAATAMATTGHNDHL
jgi:glucose-6-phosphate-specific signal transduction histidine kinase